VKAEEGREKSAGEARAGGPNWHNSKAPQLTRGSQPRFVRVIKRWWEIWSGKRCEYVCFGELDAREKKPNRVIAEWRVQTVLPESTDTIPEAPLGGFCYLAAS
jgi:hypothetical protein